MFLSDRDLDLALQVKQLLVNPPPTEIDTSSIDLHLDDISEARIWNIHAYAAQQKEAGHPPVLAVGQFESRTFGDRFTIPVPKRKGEWSDSLVYRDGDRIILEPGGFFLWQNREEVGTPEKDPRLICFVDGKSSRARTGLVVHMTAPTIHAGWWGKVTLEIANLGPFTLSLAPGDAVAQLTVAALSSPPLKQKKVRGVAIGQAHVAGGTGSPSGKKVRRKKTEEDA
jgi:dCTP deaminase